MIKFSGTLNKICIHISMLCICVLYKWFYLNFILTWYFIDFFFPKIFHILDIFVEEREEKIVSRTMLLIYKDIFIFSSKFEIGFD